MLFASKKNQAGWLVVGLGNPGKKYEGTRHNIGFAALDYAAGEWDIPVTKLRFDALCGAGRVGSQKVLLLKPQTFMNLSGVAVQKACSYYGIPSQRVLVLFDDISLAPGTLRIRTNGSAGGHNGIKSIIAAIGEDFPRIKIGVGAKPHPGYDLADWVLSRFTQEEMQAITPRFDDITKAAALIVQGDTQTAMSQYNGAAK